MTRMLIRTVALMCFWLVGTTHSATAVVLPHRTSNPVSGERVPGILVVNFKPDVRPQTRKAHPTGSVMGIPGIDDLNIRHALADYRTLFPGANPAKAPRNAPDLSGYHVLEFDPSIDLDLAFADYSADPNVEHVEFDYYAYIMRMPNDMYFGSQWDLYQVSDRDIDATDAWDNVVGAEGVILADTDTGVLYSHEDLADNIWVNPGEDIDGDRAVMDLGDQNGVDDDTNGYVDDLIGWDFVSSGSLVWPGEDGFTQDNDPKDFNGHGTHTSGTIAATTNNGKGVAGIAGGFGSPTERGCKIMCLRMGYSFNDGGTENGRTVMSYVAEAFRYAADNGAVAINYSFGSSDGGGIEAATDYAVAAGLVISASAGNSNNSSFGYLQSRTDVLCVASTNSLDQKSDFSNYGLEVDISAPGSSIRSTVSSHYTPGYATYNGTSMAAPHVVGVVGLMRTLNPALTRQECFDIIQDNADNIDALNPGYIGQLGAGRLNAAAAVQNIASTNFDAAPVLGEAPLDVQFTDLSATPATSWLWDLGDGNSSTAQNPLHTYGPGLFDVSLTIQTAIGQGYKLKPNYVVALAETLTAVDNKTPQGSPGYVEFTAVNSQPVNEIILPIRAANVPASASLDSFVTTGCRTEYFEYKQFPYDNRPTGRLCLRLRANNGGSAPPLAPGSGPIARAWFTLDAGANPANFVTIDTATLGSLPYVLTFKSTALDYVPVYHVGALYVAVIPGDMDFSGYIDVTDVVALIEIIFRGGPLPVPPDRADVNCDGTYDVLDLTTEIGHAFRGQPEPACP